MIEQIENATGQSNFLITCDGRGCKASIDARDMLFGQAVILAKNSGWRIRKVFDAWQHHCPDCIEFRLKCAAKKEGAV